MSVMVANSQLSKLVGC